MKLWWCEKLRVPGWREGGRADEGREGGRRDTNSQVTLASLVEGKTQNSNAWTIHSLLERVKRGTMAGLQYWDCVLLQIIQLIWL